MTNLLLFSAALVGGALNAVAGGGSFIALPALLSAGVAPVSANATTAFALWPGSLSAVYAYRREIVTARAWLLPLGLASLLGGLFGAWLLVRTSDQRFLQLLPWLMLIAAVTFTFGGRIAERIRKASTPAPGTLHRAPVWVLLFQLAIASYGGYFGGGMGIMTLAAFAAAGMTDIHEMNGLKVTLAVLINGIALVEFVASGAIAWIPGLVMIGGSVLGGYSGAVAARRLNPKIVQGFVVAVAWTMTAYFFLR